MATTTTRAGASPRGLAAALAAALAALVTASPALAIKPCAPDPCRGPDGSLDRGACEAAASFVVVGRLEQVVERPFEGGGVTMRFASFDVVVEAVERGDGLAPGQRLRAETAWCAADDRVFQRSSPRFRLFGAPGPPDAPVGAPARFLAFEPLDAKDPAEPPREEGRPGPASDPGADGARSPAGCACEVDGARDDLEEGAPALCLVVAAGLARRRLRCGRR